MQSSPLCTPSQTAGPFVSLGTAWLSGTSTLRDTDPGAIVVAGSVLDGDERPVTDAMLEFSQTGSRETSRRGSPQTLGGLGRVFTGPDGCYRLVTLKPETLPGAAPGQLQAPHLDVSIFARGLLQRLVTRIYFEDEEDNAADPVLAGLASLDLVSRLVAKRSSPQISGSAGGAPTYSFDIYLQGDRETVFFGPW